MQKSERRMIICFLTPIVLVYLGVFLYPSIKTLMMSFFEIQSISSPMDQWQFVGLENYISLTKNPIFLASFKNVFKIMLMGGVIVFSIAFFFAAVLNNMKGMKFWRAMIYLPNVITPIALVAMWTQYVFNNRFGFLKTFFDALGLEKLANIPWTSGEYVFWAMLIAYCFGSVGYYMIIFMAAMQKIPRDYYECANLEGANGFQAFYKITIPLMKDVLKTTVVFWCIGSVNFFLWSKVFTIGLDVNTVSPANYMYNVIFGGTGKAGNMANINVGVGTAIGVIICIAVIIVFAIIDRIFGKEKYEY